jgi:hypothetical protein
MCIVFLFLVLSHLSEGEEEEKEKGKEEVQLLEDRTVPPFKLDSNQFKPKRPLRQRTHTPSKWTTTVLQY